MATRTLNFYGYNLNDDVTILLMFDPPNPERLFIDQWPIAWKVITLRAGVHCKASVTYCARIAFSTAQVDRDNIVDAQSWIEVQSGQTVTMNNVNGGKSFTKPTNAPNSRLLSLRNRTGDRAAIGVGFVKGNGIDQRFEPTLLWTGVGNNTNVNVQFTPKLSAYITRSYQATELLRGEVETEAIWTQDLNMLSEVTGWNVYESSSGSYSFEEAAPS